MDWIVTWLVAVLTAAGGVLLPVARTLLRQAAEAAAQQALLLVQQRLGEGAARVAGHIAAEVAASPDVQHATHAMIQKGAELLEARFRETVMARAIPRDALEGMIAGELGKLRVGIAP